MNRIVTRMLDCGMPLIVEVMSGVKSAGLTWLVPAGTATEPEKLLGIGSIWSEMIMRGAGDRSSREHADALDRLGVARSTDVATYHLRVSATMLGTRMLEALPLITDMVLRPRFEEEALGPAKDLALQAIESLKDDPYERCVVAAKARHFASPLNRSTLGTVEGIESITRRDVVEGWAQRARPGGAIMAAAGAVDPDALASRLNELFQGWSGSGPEFSASGKPVRGYGHETDDTNQVQIVVVHDAPAERDAGSMLEKVAINVLSGGMSGRLFTEVREKRGLCYSVSSGYSSGRDYGVVTGYVGTTPERAQQSLDVLMEELERVNKPEGAVTRSEFDRAIVGMKSRLVFSGESTGARAASLAYDVHRLGRARGLDELAGEIDAVTLDALNGYLAKRKLGVVTIQTLGPAGLLAPIGRTHLG
jgi:predicted Zn-dependent peptidase